MNEEPQPIELNDGHIRTNPQPEPHLDPVPVPAPIDTSVKVPVYGRAWFAYIMGGLTLVGGVLTVIPQTVYIGIGITTLCGGWLAWAGIKQQKTGTWIDRVLEIIRAILEALEKWLKKNKGGS